MTNDYTYLREIEKRLIARLETLGHPFGCTLKVLAKVQQRRAIEARKNNIKDNLDLCLE